MRGVNKLIVEIKNTDNEFFDRAILFVKPGKITADQSSLNENAQKLLSAVNLEGIQKKRRLKLLLISVGALLAAAAITAGLLIFL